MHTRQTIAVIGAAEPLGFELILAFARTGNQVLAAADNGTSEVLAKQLAVIPGANRVELTDCSLQACWEADVIIITQEFSEEIAGKIRSVACRKDVVLAGTSKEAGAALKKGEELLPNSFIIHAQLDLPSNRAKDNPEVLLSAASKESIDTVRTLFSSAGFDTKTNIVHHKTIV